ncbi:MAG: hypothetical protein Q8P18_22715 [Pseudomonadota bacterium]|nr:hypothetical protein [Pseudomonadota bacterium]
MLLLVPLLYAHPGSSPGASGAARDTIGHRMELIVGADEVELRYTAEVPERRVLEEARATPGYGQQLLSSLADGVRLTWDGAPLPSTAIVVPDGVKGGEKGFLDFTVALRAPFPDDGRHGTIGVRNGNFPDVDGFFATSVTLDATLLAEETSLLKVKQGRIRDNWHGAWVKDEAAREPWVKIRPAGLLERGSGPLPLPQRMAGVAGDEPPPWVFGLLALALLPIGWLGRKLGRRARGSAG